MTMPTNTPKQALEPINWATLDQDEFAEQITALAEIKGPALTVPDMDAVERVWATQMPMRRHALATQLDLHQQLPKSINLESPDFLLTAGTAKGGRS